MIITEFYDGQGLGNQLWVYVVTRTLSKKLSMPYVILESQRFKAKDFLEIELGEIQEIENVKNKIAQNKVHYFKETMFLDMDLDCFCIDYDEELLKIQPYTKIDGYFQSEKYYFGDKTFYKSVLPIKEELIENQLVDNKTCILNIRGGEYKNNMNLLLPKSYWESAMQEMKKRHNISKFMMVTDDQDYCKELFPEIPVLGANISECYIALHQASYLIVSNSSFSYFPIKTKIENPFVIAPLHWARFNNEFKRWSSPANLYLNWNWMSFEGTLSTYEECLDNYKKNMNYYRTHYNIRTTAAITTHFSTFSIKKYIPSFLKTFIKKVIPYKMAIKLANKVR